LEGILQKKQRRASAESPVNRGLQPDQGRLEFLPAVAENQPIKKHRMKSTLSNFAARLRGLIRCSPGTLDDAQFSELAGELFALQVQNNAAYGRICQARGMMPETVRSWREIPCVPTGAFKELELSSIPAAARTAVFHSSGTTEQKPSRHFHNLESLAVYEASLWAWFAANVLPGPDHPAAGSGGPFIYEPVILTPRPTQVPHSSLVHMFEVVRRGLGAADGEVGYQGELAPDGAWNLDGEATAAALTSRRAGTEGRPFLLLGTAFSFVHLVDDLAAKQRRLVLPRGSRVMETGGYKNRSRVLPKAELHALITERLGVPAENILCEYGMSELSSQAYDAASPVPAIQPAARVFRFPPWARAQVISPETGGEVAEGETGLLRILDLANVFSVAAIQTEDLGIRRGDGFELIGRAQRAEPRGCSLMNA
jgi:hypothetical protein